MTKQTRKQPLVLASQTLRTLDGAQLAPVAGGYPTVARIKSCTGGCDK